MDNELITTVTVYATEEFPSIASCEDVEGSITVSNYLGEDMPDTPLAWCREGCELELTADEIVSEETGAVFRYKSRVSTALVVGYPVLFPPYEKTLFARMPTAGHADVTLVRAKVLGA